jgi:hypothetical protein
LAGCTLVLCISIGFNADSHLDPDPAFYLNANPNPDQRSQTNADPDPGQSQKAEIFKLKI